MEDKVLLTKEEIDKKVNEMINVIDGGNIFLDDKDKISLDASKAALSTHSEEDIVKAIGEVTAIGDRTPFAASLLTSLNQMLSSYYNETVEDYNNRVEADRVANDRVAAVDAMNFNTQEENDKLATDTIKQALSTHDETDIVNAIKEAETIQKSGNPYGNDLVNSLNQELSSYYNETVEDYNKKVEAERIINDRVLAVEAGNIFLQDNEKLTTSAIKQALSTHGEADIVSAIKEAETIQKSGNPYGNDLVNSLNQMLSSYYNETVEDYERKVEADRVVADRVSAVEAMNFNTPEESDKLSTDAIKQALSTHDERDIANAKKEAEVIKNSGNPYGEQILGALNQMATDKVEVKPVVESAVQTVTEPVVEPVVETVTEPVVEPAVEDNSAELAKLQERLDKCNENIDKINKLREKYKQDYETQIAAKNARLAELESVVDTSDDIKIVQTLEPTVFYAALDAYRTARDIPTVDNIKTMFEKTSLMKEDVEEKNKLLLAGKRLVDKHITDPEELAEVNSFCNSIDIDLSSIVDTNKDVETEKNEIRKEIEKIENDYQARLSKLDSMENVNKTRIDEINDKISKLSPPVTKAGDELEDVLKPEDLDLSMLDDNLNLGMDDTLDLSMLDNDLDLSIDENLEALNAEEDSLAKPTAIRSIKNISKKLYEKIASSKFAQAIKHILEKMREHKWATVAAGVLLTIGIGGVISVNAEMQRNMERAQQNSNDIVSENVVDNEAEIDEVKKNDVVEEKVEVELPEIMSQEVRTPEQVFEDASKDAIEKAANHEQKIYTSVDNAQQGINGLDAYTPSWTNADAGDYYTYSDGTLTAVNNNEAASIYQDGGEIVQSVENNGTTIGYVSVR